MSTESFKRIDNFDELDNVIILNFDNISEYIPNFLKNVGETVIIHTLKIVYELIYEWLKSVHNDLELINIHIVTDTGTFFIFKKNNHGYINKMET